MTFSCQGFAIRVSGLGDAWFRGPHAVATAKLFEGRHDFGSFCENPEGQESTLVVVESSEPVFGDAQSLRR